jgi:hypothetical protein
LAWHGITIAVGLLLGGLLAGRYARERLSGVTPTSLGTMVVVPQTPSALRRSASARWELLPRTIPSDLRRRSAAGSRAG